MLELNYEPINVFGRIEGKSKKSDPIKQKEFISKKLISNEYKLISKR